MDLVKKLTAPVGIAIHPIVLLSIVDHHARSVKSGKDRRVVGVLLGKSQKNFPQIVESHWNQNKDPSKI